MPYCTHNLVSLSVFCLKVATATEETEEVVVVGWEAMLGSLTEGAIVVAMEDSTREEVEEMVVEEAAAMTGVEEEDEAQETITEADKMENPKEDHTTMI